ncbi:MAG: tetratricopeptide repeat protein [Caulobacterales bacterium]
MAALILFALFALVVALACFWTLWAYRKAGGQQKRLSFVAIIAFALISLGAYAALGRPEVPDAPYDQRIEALKQRPVESYNQSELLARLNAEARAHPDDARPLLAAGAIHADEGRPEEAARAFDAALRRDPNSTFAMLNLGRALVAIDQGRVGADALRLFQAVAEREPENPTPWLYQALAATQEGRAGEERRLWGEVLKRLPAGDPRRAMAQQMISGGAR